MVFGEDVVARSASPHCLFLRARRDVFLIQVLSITALLVTFGSGVGGVLLRNESYGALKDASRPPSREASYALGYGYLCVGGTLMIASIIGLISNWIGCSSWNQQRLGLAPFRAARYNAMLYTAMVETIISMLLVLFIFNAVGINNGPSLRSVWFLLIPIPACVVLILSAVHKLAFYNDLPSAG